MKDTLVHHGILGMKWGVRRYQNEDGSLTAAGKKRYGDDSPESKEKAQTGKSVDTKKVAIGVAAGAAVVTGTVLAAYLVKKYGGKNMSEITETVDIGKAALEKVLDSSPALSTPISQIPATKVEPKEIVEKAIKSAPRAAASITQTPITRDIPQAYSFETLMGQNQDLLEKMYAQLLA